MTEKYNPQSFETRWQDKWEAEGLYRSKVDWSKPKHYALTMLPYPSGDLHIGHWFAMTPSDARARYMRMRGFNVLFPMGFDAFGLPAENAAVQRNIHPKKWTLANIERMRKQLRSMGAMFDWQREAVSCDPEYYYWTEWFFKQFYQNNLAYRGEAMVNWSPTLQAAYHTYRMEFDKTLSPQEIRWYVDGTLIHTVKANQVDATTWTNATNHGFFIILNVAIGGGWPGSPTGKTVSGVPMLVDYVRVYYR